MLALKILDETSLLEAVVVGSPESFGGVPALKAAYDPKSIAHIKDGTYPGEASIRSEMNELAQVFAKYDVEVLRPTTIENLNQVFARDIGFVIEDRFVIPKILDHRRREIDGIRPIIARVDQNKILQVHGEARIEGGDIMPHKGKIFAGYSKKADFDKYIVSRTNEAGIQFLIDNFPDWEVHPFELKKSDDDPYENALHLDCCFQPVGRDLAVLYPGGFKNQEDVEFLTNYFGSDNIITISREEMYAMNSNVFSISPDIVISERGFVRLNAELRNRGLIVEEVTYSEIAKMEGLLRCSTMPLRRRYV